MITCLFWPDEQYTYFKLHFMLYKKRWGSKRFSLRGQFFLIFTYSLQYYQIRIGSDPHNFAGSRSGLVSRACRSGSGPSISIPSKCIFLLFNENFNMLSKILKIITHLPLMWKEIYFNLPLLWIKVKKFSPSFSKCVKLGKDRIILMPIRNPDPELDRHQNGKSDPDRHRF